MRLIDADALKEKAVDADYMPTWKWLSLSDLETAPTIDPVKHGKWIGYSLTTNPPKYVCCCSLCNEVVEKKTEYCPNCGARMNL